GQQVATGTTQAFSFVPATADLYFATFTVTDGQGAAGQATARITAGQVAPRITISGAATAAEGSTYRLNLAAAGIVPDAITGLPADGPASRTVRGRITDKDGGFTESTTTILVVNAAPTAIFSIDPPSAGQFHEGDTITARFTAPTDPAAADRAGLHFSFARDP